jgi:hypothetical protein
VEDNIKIYLEAWAGSLDWIDLVQEKGVAIAVMNLAVQKKRKEILK